MSKLLFKKSVFLVLLSTTIFFVTPCFSQGNQIFKFSLSQNNDSLFYNTIVGLVPDGTFGVDRLYDATLLSSNAGNTRIYTLIEGNRYSIQGLPYLNFRLDIEMGIYVPDQGQYTLRLEELTNVPDSYDIKLIDRDNGQVLDFRTSNTHTITAGFGFDDDRFILVIQEGHVIEWDGMTWSNSTGPETQDSVVISGNYTTLASENLEFDDLYISSLASFELGEGSTLDLKGDLVNFGEVTVASGATLLTYSGSNIDSINVLRNTRYADGRYSFVGIPISASQSLVGDSLGQAIYTYDETVDYDINEGINRWIASETVALIPGQGYTQAFKKTLSFFGVPNAGDITVSGITHSTTSSNENNRGWNLIANPYPAAIDPALFIAANPQLDGLITLWDDAGSDNGRGSNADYLTVNSFGAASGPNNGSFSGYIGAMQGFFVRLTSASADSSIVFSENMRVTGQNSDSAFFRKKEIGQLRVTITSETKENDNTLLLFSDEATESFDRLYDARRFNLSPSKLSVYTTLSDVELAIQGFPEAYSQPVPLVINIPESGNYRFSLNESEEYVIFDQYTEDYLNEKHSINLEEGSYKDRFLVIKSDLVNHIIAQTNNFWLMSSETITIGHARGLDLSSTEIAITSLSGKELLRTSEFSIADNTINVSPEGLASGIYIITITYGEDKVWSAKVSI